MRKTFVMRTAVAVVGILALQPLLRGEDWPRFLGPRGDATSAETDLRVPWTGASPRQLWTQQVGAGFGGAAVRGGEVYLLDREKAQRDLLRCFDLDSGKEQWRLDYESVGRLPYEGSRSTPTVEEELVYTLGSQGELLCVDRQSHDIVWQTNLAREYSTEPPKFGYSQSPLVYEDLVIVAALAVDVGLVAYDRFTGTVEWQTKGLGTSHSTPLLSTLLGEEQILFLSRSNETGLLSGIRPEDGDLLWQSNAYTTRRSIVPPLVVGEDLLFVTGGYQAGSVLLQATKAADRIKFQERFRIRRGAQTHLPHFFDKQLYLVVNENWNHSRGRQKEGGLLCLNLEGEEVWRTGDSPFFGRGNVLRVGRHLLIQDGFNGILRVVEATPEEYQEKCRAIVFGEEGDDDLQMWAPMALSDGRLLMRSQEELVCLDLRRQVH
jgi:outer membrane protein assembly factor BamB